MKHTALKLDRSQYAVVAAAGLWLAVSPWIFGFEQSASALAACVALGPALAALAVGAMLKPRAWVHWLAVVLGLVIASAPWLFGFAGESAAARNAEAVGLVSTVLALWAGLRESGGFRRPGGDRMAH
jgi:hypothetical protein